MTNAPTTYATDREAIDAALADIHEKRPDVLDHREIFLVRAVINDHLARVAPSKPAAVGKFEPHPNQAAALTAAARRIIEHFRVYSGARTEYLAGIIRQELSDIRPTPSAQVTEPKPAAVGDGPSWDFGKLKPLMMGDYQFRFGDLTPNVPWVTIKDILRDALKHGGLVTPAPSGPSQAVEVTEKMISDGFARYVKENPSNNCGLTPCAMWVIAAEVTAALAAHPAPGSDGEGK